jgi:transcriptional regulator with XRE-family HTH domain
MTQPGGWATRMTRVIAAQVRRYRKERGLSAQRLADLCAQLGMEISRSTISDLENGRRDSMSVAELLVLAAALEVPPVELAVPLARQERAEILPGAEIPTWDAGRWFRGDGAMVERVPGRGLVFEDLDREAAKEGEDLRGLPIDWLRVHQELVDDCLAEQDIISGLASTLKELLDRGEPLQQSHHPYIRSRASRGSQEKAQERGRASDQLRVHEASLAVWERELARHRALMRDKGWIVPPLPASLERIDRLEEAGETDE